MLRSSPEQLKLKLLLLLLHLIYPTPYTAVSRGRKARRGVDMDWAGWPRAMSMPFRRCMDAPSKSPAATHALAGLYPASANWGGLLFTPGFLPYALRVSFAVRAAPARAPVGYFSLGRSREK